MVLLLFFYILYNYIINLSLLYLKDKNILVILITGFIISILSEIPLISAVYRMGFPLVLGSILSLILGIAISIIMGIIFIKNKFKINLLSNFNNILNIIYENIIYCLIMVLFTLVVKIDTNNIIDSILVIIFYALVTTIYYFIRRVLYKLR